MRTLLAVVVMVMTAATVVGQKGSPHMATGFKVGEVTAHGAIVWTRLTERATRNPPDAPMVSIRVEPRPTDGDGPRKVARVEHPEGVTVRDIRDAAPGAAGEVRVRYRPEGIEAWIDTEWQAVDPERDFTRQFELRDLRPGTRYRVVVQSRRGKARGAKLSGRFCTAPAPDDARRVVFTVSTGQGYRDRDGPHGFDLYAAMLALDPHFFVHTGDIVYYDKLAKTEELARYHWQRTYGLPSNVMFHRRVASYFIKDDHDTWFNDCWPGMQLPVAFDFTFARGVELFPEQVPMGPRTYRQRRWGRDLEIWMVEGRDFRSANTAPDGPDKTIWGTEQKRWLKESLAASDATFRILISPTPIVGPDRARKNDNHANRGFRHEGDEIRRFLAAQKNTVVICGDRHWQYHSVHPELGLREYSCGPASDAHAGGWRQSNLVASHHRYLRVRGGFLSATVERAADVAQLTLRFHDTDGEVHHRDVLVAR